MADQSCIACNSPFVTHQKGYCRRPVHKKIHGKSVADRLKEYGILSAETSFVCLQCFRLIDKTASLEKAEEEFYARSNPPMKRKFGDRTPVKTPRKLKKTRVDVATSPFVGTTCRPSPIRREWKSMAIAAIKQSKLYRALNHLMKSKAFRRALKRLVKAEVRREVAGYVMCSGRKLSQEVTQESIASFSWVEIIKELRDNLPLLHTALVAALTARNIEKEQLSTRGRFGKAVPVLGFVFAELLYGRKPRKFNFVQELCSLEMWSSGCSQKLFQHFQRLGICKGESGAVNSIDRIRKSFDKEIEDWKEDIEGFKHSNKSIGISERKGLGLSLTFDEEELAVESEKDSDDSLLPMPSSESTSMESSQSDALQVRGSASSPEISTPANSTDDGDSDSTEDKHPGYCVVWDNVQIMSTARHQTTEKQNKMLLWALSFGVQNRIGFRHLESCQITTKAQDMPLHMFLPRQEDYDLQRGRMVILVKQMLTRHLAAFQDCKVVDHIQHEHSTASKMKSRVVNLGVQDVNPSSTAGVISIMENLHKYVPELDEDKAYPILCHGDGLSVERMHGAKAARAASASKSARFEGLEPVPQEFHKRMILLQDTMDKLYKASSGADRGTLFHIRNTFNHRNVKNSVGAAFNAIFDLLEFATEGLAILLAMHLTGIKDVSEVPTGMPVDQEQIDDYLDDIANQVVSFTWQQVPAESVAQVIDAEDIEDDEEESYYEFCHCKEDTGESMIRCSNHVCKKGSWFHLSCKGLTEDDIPDRDWWCSDECRNTKHSPYCICKVHRVGQEIVRCRKGDKCNGGVYFHLTCLGISRKPDNKWICEDCQNLKGRKQKAKDDHVYLYTAALLRRGLQHLTLRDSIRENDGPAMISHWRIDMPQFWKYNHNKYLILGHNLLAGINGFHPKRIQQEMIWNRTANVRGGAGHNVPLDLLNEFLNKDFKENLKLRRGRYTEAVVARTSQFIGTLSKDLDKIFQEKISGKHIWTQSGGKANFRQDVVNFVKEYEQDNLFKIIPGRTHSAFPSFRESCTIERPEKLKKRLKKYSYLLDRSREVLP